MKRNRQQSHPNGPSGGSTPSGHPELPAGEASALSKRQKWFFRVLMGLVPLLLVFGSLELGLRLAGYGFPTGFFKPIRIGTEDCLVENDRFGLRFFPSGLARSPAPVVMKAVKPADTCRIFMLGESAALGDPRPAYGPGRYLQVLLEERFPGVRFEVICVAMTAINSHAILPIAQECARHQGDLWIIYMGNNEMVGPFGAATVFGAQAPPLRLVRLNLALQRTRVGQLLAALARNLATRSRSAQSWGGAWRCSCRAGYRQTTRANKGFITTFRPTWRTSCRLASGRSLKSF